MPFAAPIPWTTTSSGLLALTFGSFWRRDPAAAFRGLAKRALPASSSESFKSSNALIGKNTSPRTSSRSGKLLPFNSVGTDLIVLIFKVTSSPVVPFPRVSALVNFPFS
ncbi:unannotated protein [freshwater metagenome]|uniref:Unannotated protein n=1 Tax=freshwater metagenome TaxID=449393 RepID=A0A6J5ZML0_9ZZZZ